MKIDQEAVKVVDSCAAKLMEHFDSVRIFVTAHDGESGTSQNYSTGGGNYYSQVGTIQEWMDRQKAYTEKEVRKSK